VLHEYKCIAESYIYKVQTISVENHFSPTNITVADLFAKKLVIA